MTTSCSGQPRRLEESVALVCGGTRGIGLAVAVELTRCGAQVVVTGRDSAAGHAAERSIRGLGTCRFVQADVTLPGEMAEAVDACLREFGGLSIAVNSAGLAEQRSLLDSDDGHWARIIGTNLTGVWRSMHAELSAMVPRGAGSIVNVASTWGIVGRPGLSAYSAAKHGVIGLTRTAALEVSASGVRVNAVCPGTVDTAMVRSLGRTDSDLDALAAAYPMRRLASPDDVARAVRWLASDEASFVTGQIVVVDGGYTAA